MTDFVIKDSGERQTFETGMQRDTQTDKPRPDLMSPFVAERVGALYAKGARKYEERNWEKGQPFSRALASLERHLMQFKQGDTTEDHLSAVIFNASAIIHYQEMIKRGRLSADLNDLPDYSDPRVPLKPYTPDKPAEGDAGNCAKLKPAPKDPMCFYSGVFGYPGTYQVYPNEPAKTPLDGWIAQANEMKLRAALTAPGSFTIGPPTNQEPLYTIGTDGRLAGPGNKAKQLFKSDYYGDT